MSVTLFSTPGITVTQTDMLIVVESDSRGAGVYPFDPYDTQSYLGAMRQAMDELECVLLDIAAGHV
jgi:hypothetical protein